MIGIFENAGDTATEHAASGGWEVQIFVAMLGESAHSYVEAGRGQDLASFLAGNVRAFRFFQGVPRVLIPDSFPGYTVGANDREIARVEGLGRENWPGLPRYSIHQRVGGPAHER